MADLTTDPQDPRLGHGSDSTPTAQNQAYLVLSPEEIAKGFVRPLRKSYQHVGEKPQYLLRDLTEDEKERHAASNYVAYEKYPETEDPILGRFWTQAQLDRKGFDSVTIIDDTIAATYSRKPTFYGSTYCCYCRKHLPVAEFVWTDDGTKVGS